MSAIRGTAVIEGKSLTLTLEVDAEDLIHTQKMEPESDGLFAPEHVERAAYSHGHELRQRIVIRDSRGEIIDGYLGSWTLDQHTGNRLGPDALRDLQVHYTLNYELHGGERHLSFQQVARRAAVVLRPNIVLTVRIGEVSAQTLLLTRRGNVEVVHLNATDRGDSPHGRLGAVEEPGCRLGSFVMSESQRTIRAIVRIHETGVRVELFIPVPLLETWHPIARSRRDFLEIEEQLRSLKGIQRFIAAHNPLSINGHRAKDDPVGRVARLLPAPEPNPGGATGTNSTTTGEIYRRIEFLDVGEFGGTGAPPSRRLGAWTSRVRITTDYQSHERPSTLDLQWTLFNASILTGHAMILVDGRCFEHDFSTYDPHLRWKRESDGSTVSDDNRRDRQH